MLFTDQIEVRQITNVFDLASARDQVSFQDLHWRKSSNEPNRVPGHDTLAGNVRVLEHDRSSSDNALISDGAATENRGVRAYENALADDCWRQLHLAAFSAIQTRWHGRVGNDLCARADVALVADRQASQAIDQAERSDPDILSDLGLAREPGHRVVVVVAN